MRLPHAFLRRLRGEKHHPPVLVQHETFDEHEPHERLAEPHPVAKERPAMAPGDLHQRPVGLLLVAVEMLEHPRPRLVPLARGEFPAAEVLVQRLGVHVERGVLGRVPGDGPQHVVADIGRCSPVHIEPVLELRHLSAALDLDVQLDVAGEPRPGEVAGSDQSLRADHVELGMRDVRLGVELVPAVDPALDPLIGDGLDNRLDTLEQRVRVLLFLQAVVPAGRPGAAEPP